MQWCVCGAGSAGVQLVQILVLRVLKHLPEGRREDSLWAGWQESFQMQPELLLDILDGRKWVPPPAAEPGISTVCLAAFCHGAIKFPRRLKTGAPPGRRAGVELTSANVASHHSILMLSV